MDPGTFDCRNLGDVAMLQTAILRLTEAWPEARLQVLTADAAMLHFHCPEAAPVPDAGRRAWFAERTLLGRIHGRLPGWAQNGIAGLTRSLRRRWPSLLKASVQRRMSGAADRAALEIFLEALRSADLVVVAGQASLNDLFPAHAGAILDTLEAAQDLGRPTALLGQQIGPLSDPRLIERCRRVLPRAELVAVRERREGPGLLRSLGVDPDRVVATGDDAVEPAWRLRASAPGTALGVNLRVAPHSGLDAAAAASVGRVLGGFAAERGASLFGLPIASHRDARDADALRLALSEVAPSELPESESVEDVIRHTGRCRAVVTAAYHAAVFALAQGVPAVCLSGSAFSDRRFAGLADFFGEGCRVVEHRGLGVGEAVGAALAEVWPRADRFREPLLEAASRQVEAGRTAVGRLVAAVRVPRAAA